MNALVIQTVVFNCLPNDLWMAGTTVYAVVVVVVTLKVAQKQNTHTSISTFFLVGSIATFWI